MERVKATYLIETPLEVERAATMLADWQSGGTFVPVPGETDELKNRLAARVEKIMKVINDFAGKTEKNRLF